MPLHKKIKISSAKRGHHEKHKKNFAKTKKTLHKEKQLSSNIFKVKNAIKKASNGPVKKPFGNKQNTTSLEPSVEDISDMMDSVSECSEGSNDFNSSEMSENPVAEQGSDDSALEDDENEDVRNATERLEDEYQIQISGQVNYDGETKELLPIKTKKGGIVSRSAEIKPGQVDIKIPVEEDEVPESEVQITQAAPKNEIRTTDLLSEREDEIERQKFLIGVTCASILENPETKIKNLAMLVDLIPETSQSGKTNMYIIRKLAMISLVEVFKDVVPEYRLGIIDTAAQKLKKTTLARVSYENELLLQYKKFLIHCEGFTQQLRRSRKLNKQDIEEKQSIAVVAVQCMCDLLMAHPYFNYSMNIGQMLVTMLNSDQENVRKLVHSCFVTIFKTDSRFDMCKHIVRHINQLVKKKDHGVHPETVSCLKYLQIKDVNINAEKEKELKLKRLEAHKSRVINMSRQERKRKKKLAELEKELFETKAEESKQVQLKKLTDITKLVFTIFFRILKTAPNSKLLSVTLEGLSKFAHTINIEFFSDLIEVLNNLLVHANLGHREQLHCIQTVFTILKGQGEVLNIDPARFYTHFYKNLLSVHAGKNHEDLESILATLDSVLLKRRNNITYHRYLAFVKRLSMMSLQLLHNGALGCLGVMRTGMLLNTSLDILLDIDSVVGSGVYDPKVEEPEFSNANCTSLYELTALYRHYHPTVRKFANNIANGVPSSGPGMLPPDIGKLTPSELYTRYDSSKLAFNPSIPVQKQKGTVFDGTGRHLFVDYELEEMCNRAQSMHCSELGEVQFNFL
ncbi:nucleolar complex protein 3 [Ochlerotatus camptorhynchus]|uniref:nucleolar complex protein 3 n=1 Tax=Ochlerotatus camptorhynchus TaxID=644619 RepID=UPI0031DC33E3